MKKNSVRFPDGSSIEWENRETLKYSEGDLMTFVWVDFEPGFFSKGRILRASSIRNWESHPAGKNQKIPENKKKDIIEKISIYYKTNKINLQIVYDNIENNKKRRQFAAELAKEFYAGKITFDNFLIGVNGDGSDKDISELVDLITHEPKRGGFLGAPPEQHDKYLEEIYILIEKLSQ